MKDPWTVVRHPQLSEKSQRLQKENIYVFHVDPAANKGDIAAAVERIYRVKVEAVRTIRYRGKRKRNRNMLTYGKRRDWKKAYVKLREGHRLDLI